MNKLEKYLNSCEHLPKKLRDFHDQKELFKSMHILHVDNEGADNNPNWRQGHIYVIDFFLWFMASRGYTLQKTRKKGVRFEEWPNFTEIMELERDSEDLG